MNITTTAVIIPDNRTLPLALVELMGWNTPSKGQGYPREFYSVGNDGHPDSFDCIDNLNHARYAVAHCAKLGLMTKYAEFLAAEVDKDGVLALFTDKPRLPVEHMLSATPLQQSRAAYATLKTHADSLPKRSHACTTLLRACMKPHEIAGPTSVREARVTELVHWMVRYVDGNANPKWLRQHAAELAFYVADEKGI